MKFSIVPLALLSVLAQASYLPDQSDSSSTTSTISTTSNSTNSTTSSSSSTSSTSLTTLSSTSSTSHYDFFDPQNINIHQTSTYSTSSDDDSTDSYTDSSTDSYTDSSTDSYTDSSTDSYTDSTTSSYTDSSTDSYTDSTTSSYTDSTTSSSTDITTSSDTDSSSETSSVTTLSPYNSTSLSDTISSSETSSLTTSIPDSNITSVITSSSSYMNQTTLSSTSSLSIDNSTTTAVGNYSAPAAGGQLTSVSQTTTESHVSAVDHSLTNYVSEVGAKYQSEMGPEAMSTFYVDVLSLAVSASNYREFSLEVASLADIYVRLGDYGGAVDNEATTIGVPGVPPVTSYTGSDSSDIDVDQSDYDPLTNSVVNIVIGTTFSDFSDVGDLIGKYSISTVASFSSSEIPAVSNSDSLSAPINTATADESDITGLLGGQTGTDSSLGTGISSSSAYKSSYGSSVSGYDTAVSASTATDPILPGGSSSTASIVSLSSTSSSYQGGQEYLENYLQALSSSIQASVNSVRYATASNTIDLNDVVSGTATSNVKASSEGQEISSSHANAVDSYMTSQLEAFANYLTTAIGATTYSAPSVTANHALPTTTFAVVTTFNSQEIKSLASSYAIANSANYESVFSSMKSEAIAAQAAQEDAATLTGGDIYVETTGLYSLSENAEVTDAPASMYALTSSIPKSIVMFSSEGISYAATTVDASSAFVAMNSALSVYSQQLAEQLKSEGSLSLSSEWLPTSIITDTSTAAVSGISTASDTASAPSASATSKLPNAITPATQVQVTDNYTVITIGFKAALNYAFVASDSLASAQIFEFLPGALTFPFNDDSNVAVKQLVPFQASSLNYIATVAEVYFPKAWVSALNESIQTPYSIFYYNTDATEANLAALVDMNIPIIGLESADAGSSGVSSSGSTSGGSSHSSPGDQSGLTASTYGSFDSVQNSTIPANSKLSVVGSASGVSAAAYFTVLLIGYRIYSKKKGLKFTDKDGSEIVLPISDRGLIGEHEHNEKKVLYNPVYEDPALLRRQSYQSLHSVTSHARSLSKDAGIDIFGHDDGASIMTDSLTIVPEERDDMSTFEDEVGSIVPHISSPTTQGWF